MSVKDRPGPGKRGKSGKQRRDDSESFDVRSQYTPFFPPQQHPSWATVPQYAPMGISQFGNTMQNAYQTTLSPSFGQPPQQFQAASMSGGGIAPYHQMPQSHMPPNHMIHNQMGQVSSIRSSKWTENDTNIYSNIQRLVHRSISRIVHPLPLMAHLCKHLPNRRSHGPQTYIIIPIRLEDPFRERHPYLIHMDNFRAVLIQQTPRANIQSQAALTDMRSIQKRNPSSPEMAACLFSSRYLTMDHLTILTPAFPALRSTITV